MSERVKDAVQLNAVMTVQNWLFGVNGSLGEGRTLSGCERKLDVMKKLCVKKSLL